MSMCVANSECTVFFFVDYEKNSRIRRNKNQTTLSGYVSWFKSIPGLTCYFLNQEINTKLGLIIFNT